jgi:hypothetical protein
VALLDGLTPFLGLVMSQYLADRRLPRRGETLVGGGYAFYNVYETKDGHYITLGSIEKKYWVTLCTLIGKPDLIEQQFAPSPRQDEIIEELRALFRQKTRREWMDLLDGEGICFAPVNTVEEALQDPQIRHRGLWFKANHPVDGEIPQQAFPIKFSEDQPGWKSSRRWTSAKRRSAASRHRESFSRASFISPWATPCRFWPGDWRSASKAQNINVTSCPALKGKGRLDGAALSSLRSRHLTDLRDVDHVKQGLSGGRRRRMNSPPSIWSNRI